MVITFDRPEIRSPLSSEVLGLIERALDRVEGDDSIDRVVFTGVGEVFASGADLKEIATLDAETAKAFGERGQHLMGFIASLRAETVAAINGFCYGGALDLVLACDVRVAAPTATFCHPGTGLGIMTGWGGTQRLPRLIGHARALEMFFTAAPIDAVTALGFGLVDEISDDPMEYAVRRRK